MSHPSDGPESSFARRALATAGALLIGTVLTLLLFEGALRLAGLALAQEPRLASEDAEITVLAEGDSFTYGIGGLSFPSQMQEMFDARYGAGRIRVVNEGIPGITTGLVAERLEEHLRRYRPDAVVLVVGENDTWNSVRLSEALGEVDRWAWLDSVLLHSAVYKFFKVSFVLHGHANFAEARQADEVERTATTLATNREVIGYPEGEADGRYTVRDLTVWRHLGMQVDVEIVPQILEHLDALGVEDGVEGFPPREVEQTWAEALALEADGRYDEAVPRLERVAEAAQDEPRAWYRLGTSRMRLGRWDDAVAALERAAALPRARPEVWFTLGHAQRRAGRTQEAIDAWVEGLRRFPLYGPTYSGIAETLEDADGTDATDALDIVAGIDGVEGNPMHQYLLRLRDAGGHGHMQELVSRTLTADTEHIIALSHEYGAQVLFASYPHFAFEEISGACARKGAHYVDFRPIFAERFSDVSEYLSDDGCHCNSEGYRLMAERLADELEGMLGLGRHG